MYGLKVTINWIRLVSNSGKIEKMWLERRIGAIVIITAVIIPRPAIKITSPTIPPIENIKFFRFVWFLKILWKTCITVIKNRLEIQKIAKTVIISKIPIFFISVKTLLIEEYCSGVIKLEIYG